jgi:hypothetical protein
VEEGLEPEVAVEFEPGPEPAPAVEVLPRVLLMMLELPVPRGTELEGDS